jgi:hypothetical protein
MRIFGVTIEEVVIKRALQFLLIINFVRSMVIRGRVKFAFFRTRGTLGFHRDIAEPFCHSKGWFFHSF